MPQVTKHFKNYKALQILKIFYIVNFRLYQGLFFNEQNNSC